MSDVKAEDRAARVSDSTTVEGFVVFTCDLGWRTISFLKITDADGATGWAEFTESFGNRGLVAVVESLRDAVIGRDSRAISLIIGEVVANSSPVPGGINRQAVAAVENALYDLRARRLGVPVAELLGGVIRDRMPVYWSHCGTYRQGGQAAAIGVDPIRSYAELRDFATSLSGSGFRYAKTNMLAFDDPELQDRPFPWTRRPYVGGREWDERCIGAIIKTLTAFREGCGEEIGLILDVNAGYKADGFRRVEQAISAEGLNLEWIEVDGLPARTLADLRRHADTAIATGESLFGRAEYVPYLDESSFDVGIVDVMWNGIAALAETRATDIAPHNFYGHLSTYISAQFCAAIPNFNILEVDIDGVPWRDDLVEQPPRIENGHLVVPDGPGWGVEVNEEAVRAHAVAVFE